MFKDAYLKLDKNKATEILNKVNPVLEGEGFDPEKSSVLSLDLPFYPGWVLLEITDYDSLPSLKKYVVMKDNNIVVLNWTNAPVYDLNKNLPVQINDDSVLDYVRFFFTYVKGKHGRFIIVERVDDIDWNEEPPPNARKAVAKFLKPLTILEKQKDGSYLIDTRMIFKNSLFASKARVDENGFVSIFDEELLIEDMPVIDDIFAQ